MEPVMILVTYNVKNGEKNNFMKEIINNGILEKIRAEKGCISYNYYYSADDDNTVLLVEKWDEIESQRNHMQQPHMAVLKEIKEKYIVDTKVEMTVMKEER